MSFETFLDCFLILTGPFGQFHHEGDACYCTGAAIGGEKRYYLTATESCRDP